MFGVLLWPSRLRIQHCQCSSLGCCCGAGSTPGQGTSTCYRYSPSEFEKQNKQENPKLVRGRYTAIKTTHIAYLIHIEHLIYTRHFSQLFIGVKTCNPHILLLLLLLLLLILDKCPYLKRSCMPWEKAESGCLLALLLNYLFWTEHTHTIWLSLRTKVHYWWTEWD